jgi:hypothetical protein
MFANTELTQRGTFHKLLKKEASGEVTMEERHVWARSMDGAVKDASRPSRPFRYRLVRPAVVAAAVPALSAVAAALRDEDLPVSREALDAVRAFMSDGVDSPLYGGDPLAARRAAEVLRTVVVVDASAERTHGVARQHSSAA